MTVAIATILCTNTYQGVPCGSPTTGPLPTVDGKPLLDGDYCDPCRAELEKTYLYMTMKARKVERERERKGQKVKPRARQVWTPHQPTDRQKLFLDLRDEREVLFGGSAGGGKSNALLAAALEYVNIKGYSALLLRRTYADLAKPGALMDRAHQWLKGSTAKWNDQTKQWRFPSGAVLSFGYLENENDKYRFQSSEYQMIGFDELTQFQESQYLYMFSRLRRLADSDIPLRVRSATNPGGVGAKWVQERFIPDDFTPEQAVEPYVFWKEGVNADGSQVRRAFVPARLTDNPHLDRDEYAQSLSELDAVTREQLLKGDWQIRERGNVYPMWEDGVDGRHVITWEQFREVFGVPYVPTHWLGAHAHDPGFDPDPRAAVWNWVAAANGPLAGDVFCTRELYATRMTVDEFAEAVLAAETYYSESARIQSRLIGHEASSEQATLRQKHGLSYRKGKPDANGGIAQMRHQLRVTDFDKPHPFKSHLKGRPHFYVVIDGQQLINPRDERGMVNFRAEMAAYRYIDGSPTQHRGVPRIVPYDFFNHLMDAQRNLAANWFAPILSLTPAEEREQRLVPELQHDAVINIADPAVRAQAETSRRAHLQRMESDERQAAKAASRMAMPRVRFRR